MPIDISKAITFQPIPYQTKNKRIQKEWGCEYILPSNPANGESYTTKIMEVKPGFQASLHHHLIKHETFVLIQGTMNVELYAPDSTKHTIILDKPMSSVIVPCGIPHTFSVPAEQEFNTIFIESSSVDREDDNYRLTRSRMNAK